VRQVSKSAVDRCKDRERAITLQRVDKAGSLNSGDEGVELAGADSGVDNVSPGGGAVVMRIVDGLRMAHGHCRDRDEGGGDRRDRDKTHYALPFSVQLRPAVATAGRMSGGVSCM
jgi:hypothetical protein